MKIVLRNIFLLILAVALSYFIANYFGSLYDQFSPQRDSLFGAPKEVTNIVIGLPFAYTLFLPLLFQLFGSGNKKKWIMILLIPPALLFISGDLAHIYLPIIAAAVGWYVGLGLNKLFFRNKNTSIPKSN